MSRMIDSRWSPGIATALAFIACYGTGLLIATLSLLGISLALDEHVWAGAVSALAALATFLIGVSSWRRRVIHPAAIAAIGFALILWTMYGSYSRVVELVGFAFLAVAALLHGRARLAPQSAAGDVSWIEVPDLFARLERDPALFVLDVRGADEFTGELGHIPSARNVPVGELQSRLGEIEAQRDKAVILVCRTDKRSARAAGILHAAGFRDVQVLCGGMEQWTRDNLPVEDSSASRPP